MIYEFIIIQKYFEVLSRMTAYSSPIITKNRVRSADI